MLLTRDVTRSFRMFVEYAHSKKAYRLNPERLNSLILWVEMLPVDLYPSLIPSSMYMNEVVYVRWGCPTRRVQVTFCLVAGPRSIHVEWTKEGIDLHSSLSGNNEEEGERIAALVAGMFLYEK